MERIQLNTIQSQLSSVESDLDVEIDSDIFELAVNSKLTSRSIRNAERLYDMELSKDDGELVSGKDLLKLSTEHDLRGRHFEVLRAYETSEFNNDSS